MEINKPQGKLGILIAGVGGAVASTFIAGTIAARKGTAKPFGSLTQMARTGVAGQNGMEYHYLKDILPIAALDDIVFGGWDIFPENVYEAALYAEVLTKEDIEAVRPELESIKPMKGVFDRNFVKRLCGTYTKDEDTRWRLTERLREDIRDFKKENGCERIVVIWAGSTEVFISESAPHRTLAELEMAMKEDLREAVPPSMCYAYAAMSEGCPFVMGAPNLCVDIPAMAELAADMCVPVCGKDFKTGQTMLKTVLAPMFRSRMLALDGWFSTNILGNRDGEVLDDPDSFKTKEESKLSVLGSILRPDVYPELYGDIYHKVRINYYPPRKDNKEGWDNIDFKGWMGYPMQLKVDFLCRDSILAAPLCLDLVLFSDLALRCGWYGTQEWLSFYFKSPMSVSGDIPVHDLFAQETMLYDTLRPLMKFPEGER